MSGLFIYLFIYLLFFHDRASLCCPGHFSLIFYYFVYMGVCLHVCLYSQRPKGLVDPLELEVLGLLVGAGTHTWVFWETACALNH